MSTFSARLGIVAALVVSPWLAVPASGAAPTETRTGWAALSRVEPGTAIVVRLTDGRRLDRYMVGTTADALNTVDLSLVSSRERRARILALVRESPGRYAGPVFVVEHGTQIPITQPIDRAMIVMVSRPKSLVFTLRTPVDWMLHYAGPCPNCDTAQTILNGQTPLPSPLLRKAGADPLVGEVLYRAPVPLGTRLLDDVTWEQLRLLLPVSLRGK